MHAALKNLPEPAEVERRVTVLAVSPRAADHERLAAIFGHSNWSFFRALSCREAIEFLRDHRVAVLICESALPDGDWKRLLQSLCSLPAPPLLIVTARDAPETLWAEALNLGAYDVLSQPFDRVEVTRLVSLAWLHWRDEMVQTRSRKAANGFGGPNAAGVTTA